MVVAINDALVRLEGALEAERAFTAEAAHALRTPLAVLSARVAQLPDMAIVGALRADVTGLNRLIDQMLSAAQADTLVVDPDIRCDLANTARSVIADMAPLAIASGRSLAFEGAEESWIIGDADAIAHALRNLVDNGLRYTPPGTEVVVRVDGEGHLSVRDRGPGFPPERRALAFKRFWRGSVSELGGTGLGLAIVKRIAEAHGAQASIGDAPAGGAVVAVKFAAAAAKGS